MQDIEDLVGNPARERPRKKLDLDDIITRNRAGGILVDDLLQGVTVSWLSQVFSMDPKTVKLRLADCPPLHRRKAGYVYSLPVACQYLVKPAVTWEHFMKNMKSADLPTHVQQTFWDAALKRQRWEENAGDLWRTEKVLEVLGETFKSIKTSIQLWVDTIEKQKGVTEEQRVLLYELCDKLQTDIYKKLVEDIKKSRTMAQASELPSMIGDKSVEDDVNELV